jgi:hypothetical protein
MRRHSPRTINGEHTVNATSTLYLDLLVLKSASTKVLLSLRTNLREGAKIEFGCLPLLPAPGMAPRRRTTRKNKNGATEGGSTKSLSDHESVADNAGSQGKAAVEVCPACNTNNAQVGEDDKPDVWIRCDTCKSWFHWACVADEGQDHELVANW